MSKRSWATAAMTLSVIALAWSMTFWQTTNCLAADPALASTQGSKKAAALFGLAKVHKVHLSLSEKEWAKMQPAAPCFPFGPGGGAPKSKEKSADVHKGGGFGTDFPWARGEITIDDKTLKDVALRFKGNFTYMASSRGLKRPWKIDLDRHIEGQQFLGQKKLNLNNGQTDLSKARESLSYAVFRAAGVPAPRTAFAEVTLTVPGKYDKEFVGLYTLVEQVDKVFLKDRFKDAKGMLLKPEGLQNGLQHFGEDWKQYDQRYRPKGQPDKKQQKRLIDFTRLVNQPDDERFRKEIASYLDIDQFLRFLAANALLANLDSFLGFGHNFYLYLRPDTNKFVFIPWDTDLSMAAWPVGGTPEQQVELSIMHPHRGQNKLIDRLLAMPEVNAQYRKLLKELTATCFTKERLLADLDAIENTVKEPLAQETKAVRARKEAPGGFGFGVPAGGVFGQTLPPRMFIEKRTASVAGQLAGKSKGFVPPAGFGFGPPGGGFGPPGGGFPTPPRPGELMPRPLQDQLKLTEQQRKQFEELQREVDRKVEELLTDDQKALLRKMRSRTGFPPGGGKP